MMNFPDFLNLSIASPSQLLAGTTQIEEDPQRVKQSRIRYNATHDAGGEPELIVAGRMGDDFCIDEDAEVLYLATHRQNTIDRVSMSPSKNSGFTESVVGDPFTEEVIGPSGGVWGRGSCEYGPVAYFITDGGTASPPPDGIARPAKVLRVQL
jgi:hypothetical protein